MIEKIAMWGGVAGIAVALVAILVICFVKSDIRNMLNKDVILFDQNFELKKNALNKALEMIDEIETRGEQVTLMPEYVDRARKVYNELICVVTNMRVADEFHSITIAKDAEITPVRLANFKLAVRHDIGLSNKNTTIAKRAKNTSFNTNETMMKARTLNEQYSYEQPVQSSQPVPPAQPVRRPAPQGTPARRQAPRPTNPNTNQE